MSQRDFFAQFEGEDFRGNGELGIFAISYHAKLIGYNKDSWIVSGLEVVYAWVSEESNATEFGGWLVGDANKAGTKIGNVSQYDLVDTKNTVTKDTYDAIVGGDKTVNQLEFSICVKEYPV